MPEMMHCPYHEDSTPSMAIYDNMFICFGCGAKGPVQDLGITPITEPKEKYVEPLQETIAYVQGLPKKDIRGLSLPYDDRGYYLLWPNDNYYIRRNWGDEKPKYKCPSGHSKPLFVAHTETTDRPLIIVEGQFNALSIAKSNIKATIVSPGSATDFSKINYKPFFCVYTNIMLILDCDAAGSIAGIELKAALLDNRRNVQIKLMPVNEDANEVLQKEGKEVLRQRVEGFLREARMSGGMQTS